MNENLFKKNIDFFYSCFLDDLDLSGLTLHNAKRLEMESQVKLLELENTLAKERLRLSALRRQHYLLAPEAEQLPPI